MYLACYFDFFPLVTFPHCLRYLMGEETRKSRNWEKEDWLLSHRTYLVSVLFFILILSLLISLLSTSYVLLGLQDKKNHIYELQHETLVTTLRCKCIAALYYTKPYSFSFDSLTFKCFAPLYYHSVRKACVWACTLPHLPLPPGTGHPVCPLAGLDFQLSECTQITEQVKTGYKVYFSS